MKSYTVEVTTAPAVDGDFSAYHRVIDAVPGTLLIEDAESPMLIVPVDADSPMKAAQFVDGLAKLVNIEPISGTIYPTPTADFDLDDDDTTGVATTPAVEALSEWVESQPAPPRVAELLDA